MSPSFTSSIRCTQTPILCVSERVRFPKNSSLRIFGNGMKYNHFLMSWWEDGSYPIWTSCEAVGTLSQWPLLSVRDTTSVSLHFSVIQWLHCREINPFWISWLKLLSTVRWGLSSMNICKLDIFSWRLLSVSQSNWLVSSWYESGRNLGPSSDHLLRF